MEEGNIEGIHFHRFFSLKKWQKKEEREVWMDTLSYMSPIP